MNILKLERSVIERTVSEKLIGIYCISYFVDKKFFVRYSQEIKAGLHGGF